MVHHYFSHSVLWHNRGNMRLWTVLLLALLNQAFAAEESCMGRCENGFDVQRKCQCDSMCKYYKSCCSDYESICSMMTRGDTFVLAEDDDELLEDTTPSMATGGISRQLKPTQQPISDFSRKPQKHPETTLEMTKPTLLMEIISKKTPVMEITHISQTVPPPQDVPTTTEPPQTDPTTVPITAPTEAPDPDAVVCSGRPFDSFMQVKNGSTYAFRGDYFFELDQKSVLPGYPKLIKDVWGIDGPIDAAFTRVNCQGKTYIFKGNRYWRFDDGVLDDDYPRDISVGFDKIPDHVDAAFALPAPGHNGREKVYFFKADQYYTYEFMHQPSHHECIAMSERSPSALFRDYTGIYYNNYQHYLSQLFSNSPQHHDKHHFIDKDWKGLKSPVDAVLTGRMFVPPRRPTPQQWGPQPGQQWNQQYPPYGQQWNQQWGRRRQSRSPFWESMAEQGMNMGQDIAEMGREMGLRLAERQREMGRELAERQREMGRRLAERQMEMGRRMAERRMEMEERLGRIWDRRGDQDWDQDRRQDSQNNGGNYDSRSDWMYLQPPERSMPIQTVYFFKGDKYYRVDLRSKRVDPAMPPYPRSIAKYWLGCTDNPGAEK
ncbi:vitronectin a isoform X1 [Larimichthys crocea]|uniref:vitronectin a isoform X1 n=1 Tax=Larimichthys crocea TaxID=215358 RepID=UPI000F5F86EE|nr:vitronectin isoform X1 [Larimichthys crocea]